VGVPIFLGLAVAVAVIAHLALRRFVVAVIASTLLTAVGFQVVVSIQLGHVDPLFPIAFVVSSAVAGVVSATVGALMRLTKSSRGSTG
jgi:hypothetical protein